MFKPEDLMRGTTALCGAKAQLSPIVTPSFDWLLCNGDY